METIATRVLEALMRSYGGRMSTGQLAYSAGYEHPKNIRPTLYALQDKGYVRVRNGIGWQILPPGVDVARQIQEIRIME